VHGAIAVGAGDVDVLSPTQSLVEALGAINVRRGDYNDL
jgi:hypothetical protein